MFLPPRPETTKIPESIKSMDALVDNSMGLKNKIVVGWGNWGRSPNLKGSAPTPGIGFRRRAQTRFQTVTVDEHFTSQDCPCCGERKLENPKIGKEQVSKHHLLHCRNEACQCRWWNRNVVGSLNILIRFMKGLLPSIEGDQSPSHPG